MTPAETRARMAVLAAELAELCALPPPPPVSRFRATVRWRSGNPPFVLRGVTGITYGRDDDASDQLDWVRIEAGGARHVMPLAMVAGFELAPEDEA